MKTKIYDVAIVGAGIPGLYAARELAKSGLKVILFDRSDTPGEPNYSTAGIPKYAIEYFDVPKKGINKDIDVIVYATSQNICRKQTKDIYGYVLDFRRTKVLMAEQVVKSGGEVLWGVNIDRVLRDADSYTLFSKDAEYESKYLIDASGISSRIGENMGVEEKIDDKLSVGEEYIIETKSDRIKSYRGSMGLILDTKLAPFGYAWVFDNGNDTFKVGLAEYHVDPSRNLPSIDERLEVFTNWLLGDDKFKILEKHGGGRLITDKYKKYYDDRMLGIGDSVSAINPFFGEGIRQGLYSAKFAVEAILEDVKSNCGLDSYRRKMNSYHDYKWAMTSFISYQIYRRPSQWVYDAMIQYMDKYLTGEEAVDVGFYYRIDKLIQAKPREFIKIGLKQLFH